MTNQQIIKVQDLADLLGLSRRQCLDLSKLSPPVLSKNNDGCYLLFPSVRGYIALIKDRGGVSSGDPRARLAEAKARIAEAEAAKLEGEWLPVAAFAGAWAELATIVKTKLLAVESRVPPEARIATRAAIHEALNELADYDPSELAAKIAAEVSGGIPPAAEPDGQ